MAYEKFKTVMSPTEFFSDWNKASLDAISDSNKEEIYNKYLLKCVVFQRDNFKCVNEGCDSPESDLTLHHIKFRKNNGKDSPRNACTLCKSCHKNFHRGKEPLTFWGATYRVHIEDKGIDWKDLKFKNRRYRKTLKIQGEFGGIRISYELWVLLMKYLDKSYEEMDAIDDD